MCREPSDSMRVIAFGEQTAYLSKASPASSRHREGYATHPAMGKFENVQRRRNYQRRHAEKNHGVPTEVIAMGMVN